jgi:hypothetical protein
MHSTSYLRRLNVTLPCSGANRLVAPGTAKCAAPPPRECESPAVGGASRPFGHAVGAEALERRRLM